MNKVQLTGRLTADPEIRVYNNEKGDIYIANYSLAVARRFKKDEVDFFRCVSFGKTAQFLEKYISKGSRIVAAGRIQQDRWTDKESGKERSAVVVVVDEVEFAQSNPASHTETEPSEEQFMNIPDAIEDEVPFGNDEEIVTERIKAFLDNYEIDG